MALDINKKYENKPLAEYRIKLRSTERFLRQFYTPEWLQKPTKTSLIISLVVWAIGISLVLFNRALSPAEKEGNFPTNLMAIAATCTIISICFRYVKGRKKNIDLNATNK